MGLDLQGGTHLLMAVKLEEAVKTQLKRRGDDLKKELKENKIDADITQDPNTGALVVSLKGNADSSAFNDIVSKSFPDLTISSGSTESGAPAYILKYKPMQVTQIESNAMDQALETIRNRIDQLGVRETTVVKEGENEILVQLPGIQDPQEAKNLIGKTAVLEFKLEDDRIAVADALKDGPPPGDEILYGQPQAGGRSRTWSRSKR